MGCACSRAVDADRVLGATRDELRELYQRSISQNDGKLIVCGLLHRANSVNNNRRVYPKKILQREVIRYQKIHMKNGTALGELDHPSYVSPTFRCLNLSNVSHQVLHLYWEGDNLMGYIEVLQTPAGKLLGELFKSGCQVGVSSRGWASLREVNGWITIQEDFELITFDFVTEPSTQGAFLRPVQGKYRRVPDQKAVTELAYAASVSKIKQPEAVPSVEDGILPMDANLKIAMQSLHRQLDGPQKSIASGPHNIEEGLEANGRLEAPHIGINAVLPPHPTKIKQPRENGGGQASGSGGSGTSSGRKSISAKASGGSQKDVILPRPPMSESGGTKQPAIINPAARDLELEMRLPNMPVSVA